MDIRKIKGLSQEIYQLQNLNKRYPGTSFGESLVKCHETINYFEKLISDFSSLQKIILRSYYIENEDVCNIALLTRSSEGATERMIKVLTEKIEQKIISDENDSV